MTPARRADATGLGRQKAMAWASATIRRRIAAAVLVASPLALAACQSQTTAKGEQPTAVAPKSVELPGVDTSQLTAREKEQWSAYVTELLAPCSDQPVSLAQCVTDKRDCDTCVPAAKFLSNQVTKGKTRSQAEAAYRARFSPDEVKEIDIGDSPSKGASDPVVTIVEWADFECPFCGMASPALGKIVKQYGDKVRIVFKNYPLSSHEHSEEAARAAVAAGMQGKFWQLHDLMFANQQQLDEKGIEGLAKQVGLDLVKFKADQKSEAVADSVAADRKQAEKLGLRGTPMIYINGRYFDLEKFDLAEDLEPWIQLEAELRTGRPATAKVAASSAPSGTSSAPVASAASDKPEQSEKPAPKGNRDEAKAGGAKDAPAAATVRPHESAGQGG